MQTVQPHVVFLELCKNRLGILELSEERVLEESKDVSFHKLQQSIKKVLQFTLNFLFFV